MKTLIALLIVLFVGTALTLAFWAVKSWVVNTREEKRRKKEQFINLNRTLNYTDKKS